MNTFTLNTVRTTEDARTINRIMAVNRFVTLAAIFFLVSFTWALNITRFDPFIALAYVLPAIAAANFAWLWYCRAREAKEFYFLPQVLIDTGLIVLGVYFSGELYSDFLFLPLIVLSLAAFVSWQLSFTTFAFSFIAYSFMFSYSMFGLPLQEIIQSLGGLNGMRFIRVLLFAFMGVLTSFTISYFVNEIRRRNKEVEDIKREAYAKVVRGLCDFLTAGRWMLEEFDDEKLLSHNPELAGYVQFLRQFGKETSARTRESLAVVNNDFLPTAADAHK